MFNIKSSLQWFGDKILKNVNDKIDQGAINCGERVVALAKQYVHVDTGDLQKSIGYEYNAASKTVRITVGEPYGVFEEFGTYNREPHPFLRPAIAAAGPAFLAPFGIDVAMNTTLPIGYTPRKIQKHIRPKIAAAQKKFSTGKVKRTDIAFKHVGKVGGKPVNAWSAHRNMNTLFTSKKAWN